MLYKAQEETSSFFSAAVGEQRVNDIRVRYILSKHYGAVLAVGKQRYRNTHPPSSMQAVTWNCMPTPAAKAPAAGGTCRWVQANRHLPSRACSCPLGVVNALPHNNMSLTSFFQMGKSKCKWNKFNMLVGL